MPNTNPTIILLGKLRTLDQIITHQPEWLDKNCMDSAATLAILKEHQAKLTEAMQAFNLALELAQKQMDTISTSMLRLPEGTSSPLLAALVAGELDATFMSLSGPIGHYYGSGSGSSGPR